MSSDKEYYCAFSTIFFLNFFVAILLVGYSNLNNVKLKNHNNQIKAQSSLSEVMC
jgi:hypothetical protein